jgi:RNA polymerase sigma-70 factor (ECF subfamily)
VSEGPEALEVVRAGTGSDMAAAFEDFFAVQVGQLVGLAFLLTGDLADAQDLAQETLLRVWQRWGRVAQYEKPEAFARRVLHNLAIGRWRRRASLPRPAYAAALPAPSVGHLDLVRALAKLPERERSAIVLHDVAGLTAAEIAEEVGARASTVRKWLSRGRTRLAADLHRDHLDAGGKEGCP